MSDIVALEKIKFVYQKSYHSWFTLRDILYHKYKHKLRNRERKLSRSVTVALSLSVRLGKYRFFSGYLYFMGYIWVCCGVLLVKTPSYNHVWKRTWYAMKLEREMCDRIAMMIFTLVFHPLLIINTPHP